MIYDLFNSFSPLPSQETELPPPPTSELRRRYFDRFAGGKRSKRSPSKHKPFKNSIKKQLLRLSCYKLNLLPTFKILRRLKITFLLTNRSLVFKRTVRAQYRFDLCSALRTKQLIWHQAARSQTHANEIVRAVCLR
jgi:hypothetical protein